MTADGQVDGAADGGADEGAGRGLVFDCDGVLADTERFGHLPAFNQMFAEFGLPVQWTEAEYGEKLAIGGGKERMASLLTDEFVAAANLPTDPDAQRDLLAAWHKRKTEIYTDLVASGRLPGRPGIRRVVTEALAAGWSTAVASTSADASVRAVLEHVVGSEIAAQFLVLAGDIVAHKKPAPDIYLLARERLGLPAASLLVVEDSANGWHAAQAAGLTCVVTVNGYTAGEDLTGAALVVSSLGDPDGEHTHVLASGTKTPVGDWVTLGTLAAVLTNSPAREST
jgi:HAD superfamily hydrolase (TIGR01509 family)